MSSLKVDNIPYAEISERRHVFLNTNIKRRLGVFSDIRLPKVFQSSNVQKPVSSLDTGCFIGFPIMDSDNQLTLTNILDGMAPLIYQHTSTNHSQPVFVNIAQMGCSNGPSEPMLCPRDLHPCPCGCRSFAPWRRYARTTSQDPGGGMI